MWWRFLALRYCVGHNSRAFGDHWVSSSLKGLCLCHLRMSVVLLCSAYRAFSCSLLFLGSFSAIFCPYYLWYGLPLRYHRPVTLFGFFPSGCGAGWRFFYPSHCGFMWRTDLSCSDYRGIFVKHVPTVFDIQQLVGWPIFDLSFCRPVIVCCSSCSYRIFFSICQVFFQRDCSGSGLRPGKFTPGHHFSGSRKYGSCIQRPAGYCHC